MTSQVLKLWGVESLIINGTMTFAERSRVVNEFRTNPSCPRVLIFSVVGAVGLNLSMSDTLILLESISLPCRIIGS